MPLPYPQCPDPPSFTDWESYDKFRETWTIPSIPTLLSSSTTRPDGSKASLVQQMLEQLRNGAPGFTEFATSGASDGERTVSVPLQKLDRCYVCAKTEGLRLCNSCASAIYCSRECQKKDWKEHKQVCAHTHQINLKIFHPFIAYMFEYLRARRAPHHNPDNFHPALCHKILKAPIPGPRKSKSNTSDKPIHHTVTLGDTHDMKEGHGITTWIRGAKAAEDRMKLYNQVIRETFTFELTVSISLILLSEIYSTYLVRKKDISNITDEEEDDEYEAIRRYLYPETERSDPWEARTCFRLEYGRSPISDFGICKGRVVGKSNRLQTYTYYDPKANTRTMVHDPDNHYWLYFRTIKGEELTLDCTSYSFGMEACVDASHCLEKLPEILRMKGSVRVPANFKTPSDSTTPTTSSESSSTKNQSYILVEEHRFSVMHNTDLHSAISKTYLHETPREKTIIRNFMNTLLAAGSGEPPKQCTFEQEERVWWYRVLGSPMLTQVLAGRHWQDWGKSMIHHDSLWDRVKSGSASGGAPGKNAEVNELLKGSRFDPRCKEFLRDSAGESGGDTKGNMSGSAGFGGLWGLINEAMGLDWSDRCQN